MSSRITHQFVGSSTCISLASVFIDFLWCSSTWLTNSGVFWWLHITDNVISYMKRLLHETWLVPSSLLTLKMNDWASFEIVATFELKCSWATEPMISCFFISAINLDSDMYICKRKNICNYNIQSDISLYNMYTRILDASSTSAYLHYISICKLFNGFHFPVRVNKASFIE